jgi:hypothetical protein
MPRESAQRDYSGLDSHGAAWDRQGMQIAAHRGRQTTLMVVLAALVACVCVGLFACRDREASDGAGGQSGDEGRSPHRFVNGAGGGTAALP